MSNPADLRLGRWQDVLADVSSVDALITDPPYSGRTHEGSADLPGERRELSYSAWTPEDVAAFVTHWSPRTTGWMACMTSHDLAPAYQAAYEDAGRFAFAPVIIIQPRVRLLGDGPASCAVYLCVARPRAKAFMSWGALPGWYHATQRAVHIGGKPLELMRAIVRDYSRPGDLVCDPCAGAGTTLRAATLDGRRAIGAEVDPETHAKASGKAPEKDGQLSLLGGCA